MPSKTPGLGLARHMRRNPSMTERQLWRLLRDRRLGGMKFRRQVPIGPYIADFICLGERLIVEADGPLHDPEHDAERDAWLDSQGFKVLRFANALIADNSQAVFSAILAAARAR
jgi:very-short-patch-repair endonuclease